MEAERADRFLAAFIMTLLWYFTHLHT
jgi:hypothetical protein